MMQKANSEKLREYRQKAAELGSFRKELDGTLGQLGPLQLQDAFGRFKQLDAEFKDLGATLGPNGVFQAKYGVGVINDHAVSFVIPKGCSRIEIVEEALGLVAGRHLLSPEYLTTCRKSPRFQAQVRQTLSLGIDGHVEKLDGMGYWQQDALLMSKGFSPAKLEDLVVAFAVFYVATGASLFGPKKAGALQEEWMVRCASQGGGESHSYALQFTDRGLTLEYLGEAATATNVAIASRIF